MSFPRRPCTRSSPVRALIWSASAFPWIRSLPGVPLMTAPYAVVASRPVMIAVEAAAGLPDYLQWLAAETRRED